MLRGMSYLLYAPLVFGPSVSQFRLGPWLGMALRVSSTWSLYEDRMDQVNHPLIDANLRRFPDLPTPTQPNGIRPSGSTGPWESWKWVRAETSTELSWTAAPRTTNPSTPSSQNDGDRLLSLSIDPCSQSSLSARDSRTAIPLLQYHTQFSSSTNHS
jgi:hypothetical protein